MKIVITGSSGLLGRTLYKVLLPHHVIALEHKHLDINSERDVINCFKDIMPDVVINCAAFTKVDDCELNPVKAFEVNAIGARNVALACECVGARLITISTDYVFDGDKSGEYTEEDKATGGYTVYGRSKLWGEKLVELYCTNYVIVRTAWLYGKGGPSFVHSILEKSSNQDSIQVVNDQYGNPTSALAVSLTISQILYNSSIKGIFHVTCEGTTSWYEFAKEIINIAELNIKINPCSSDKLKRIAKRPANSSLSKNKLKQFNLKPVPHWKKEIRYFLYTDLMKKK